MHWKIFLYNKKLAESLCGEDIGIFEKKSYFSNSASAVLLAGLDSKW
jgi:hypothetical protein